MSLNLAQVENSFVFQTGQDVMAKNGVVLFGMSPGNPYFKSRVIEDYVEYLGKEKRRIVVVVPEQPAEHTYRAMGSKNAVKRAKRNSSLLKSHCRRAIEKVSKSRHFWKHSPQGCPQPFFEVYSHLLHCSSRAEKQIYYPS